MNILSYGSDRGVGAVNEDIVGSCGSYAWIFDGATATGHVEIPGARSDAEWLVRRFDRTIFRLVEAGSHGPLPDLARHMILDVRGALERLGLSPDRLTPYASGAIVRSTGRHVEYYLLGDVTIVIQIGDRCEVVVDARAVRAASMAVSLAGKFSGEELRRKQREFEQQFVNQVDGYWLFGTSVESVRHGVSSQMEINGSALVLLATDGFARAVEGFGLAESWPSLIDQLVSQGESGVASVISALRRLEIDPRYLEVPRIKRSDDATAMLMRVGAAVAGGGV